MDTFEFLSIQRTIHRGLRVLLKNSFLHAEEITGSPSHGNKAASRRRSAPPRITHQADAQIPLDSVQPRTTTIMIRNIPSRFNQASMLECIGGAFDICQIDFYYLPIDFKSGKNLGYAFVNFVSPAALSEFVSLFEQKSLTPTSSKVLSITLAKIQGFTKNFNLFKTSAVMTHAPPQFRPMIKCSVCGELSPLASPMDECVSEVLCKSMCDRS